MYETFFHRYFKVARSVKDGAYFASHHSILAAKYFSSQKPKMGVLV